MGMTGANDVPSTCSPAVGVVRRVRARSSGLLRNNQLQVLNDFLSCWCCRVDTVQVCTAVGVGTTSSPLVRCCSATAASWRHVKTHSGTGLLITVLQPVDALASGFASEGICGPWASVMMLAPTTVVVEHLLIPARVRSEWVWGLIFSHLWIGRTKHPGPAPPVILLLNLFNVGVWLTHGDLALEAGVYFPAVVEHWLIPARVRSEWARLKK